jgi:type II secretory pathway pseudopilin PulG
MKSNVKQSNKRAAFTIVELLTVMSIIVILIGLLVPALNKVREFAQEVKQKAQLKSIDTAIELFNTTFDGYPDSSATGPDGPEYCGAMKLCEAAMGQDLQGFHPDSIFRADGSDGFRALYPDANNVSQAAYRDNLSMRKALTCRSTTQTPSGSATCMPIPRLSHPGTLCFATCLSA